jgi:hypothetical protein
MVARNHLTLTYTADEMTNGHIDDAKVAERVRMVMKYCGDPTQTAFAKRLGVSLARINNVIRGQPLGKHMADIIVRRVPGGIRTDWLLYGDTRGMPRELVDALQGAETTRKGNTSP